VKKSTNLLIITLFLFANSNSFGQGPYKSLPKKVSVNTTLDKGNYLLTGETVVNAGVTLTIKSEASILFGKDAQLTMYGSLDISGKPKGLINLESQDPLKPGKGIVIKGADESNITVSYARFKHLSKPLHFERNWLRESVIIKNSVFKFTDIYGAAIEVNDIDNVLATKIVNLKIENNTFSNNSGSILISNISSENITTTLIGNVITRNEYIGKDRNGMFTSPVFFNYNTSSNPQTPLVQNNSVFDNYSNLIFEDTLTVEYTNICVVGSAERLNVSNNYFGNPKNKEIEKTFDFVSANFKAPLLYFNKVNDKPDASLNGHFYKVLVNNEELSELVSFQKLNLSAIDMKFNKPIMNADKYSVKYYYLDGDTLYGKDLKNTLNWSDGNKYVKIIVNDDLPKRQSNGYIAIDGFFDENGMDVPALYVGKKQFFKNNGIELVITNFLKKIPRKEILVKESKIAPTVNKTPEKPSEPDPVVKEMIFNISKYDSTSDPTDTINKVHKTSKFWEAGIFVGNSVYWGDLVTTTIGFSLSNARPALGIRTRYHITERFQVNIFSNFLVIAGTDNNQTSLGKQRGTGFERGLSFRTYIFDIGSTVEFDILRYRTIRGVVPSVFAGFNFYNFTPTAKVDGKWYKLRPIGTEGQTLSGGEGPYKKWSYGIPIGFSIKRHLGQKNIVGLSYTYNKIFTDYLDDVSTGIYPDKEALKQANPGLGDVSGQLSNPNDQIGPRSLSNDFDGFGYWGFSWTHKFYK